MVKLPNQWGILAVFVKGPEPKNRADIRVSRPECPLIEEFRVFPHRFRWGVKAGGRGDCGEQVDFKMIVSGVYW
ncbi:MAG: hypothetical protein GXO97_01860 [Nitrospirae bacterium]|nr:hypothetical protein [Nitrospirota bacterium]